jgi:hypothetical protein
VTGPEITEYNSAPDEGVRIMKWTATKDKNASDSWRVEALDFRNEGVVYVAIFSGPKARERAEEYAGWKSRPARGVAAQKTTSAMISSTQV